MNERLLLRIAHIVVRAILDDPGTASDIPQGLRREMEDLRKDLVDAVYPAGLPEAYK
ncbi:MAG: hypothetical protein KGL39_11415 [Patescibacteria group bacterium]|nr:hypothetical protein [Patescibacteria group bacterium]